MNDKSKIFCLMGPTASGKTDLALELSKEFPFEIISVDSAIIYRGMDIGTAKPTLEERQIVPHHLIDICDSKETYSAGQFRRDALEKIQDIFSRGKIPLLVGGTVLYFHVLQYGISELPKSDEKTREKIAREKDEFGLDFLFQRLQEVDPESAKRFQPTDSQRIQRALEIYEMTGKTLTGLQKSSPPKSIPYDIVNFVLSPLDINIIRSKAVKRFKEMLRLGFIDEVEGLRKRADLHLGLPSMRTVGYRQIWQYLEGELSYEEMLDLVPIVTGQLAKRQLTWLRKWDEVPWFDSDSDSLFYDVKNCLM